jgi:ornithine carbamoyltransferase
MARHVLSVADLGRDGVAEVLRLARAEPVPPILDGQGVALVFEHPSARTRNAAELAVVALGGHPVAIRGDEVGIDRREPAEDVARTLACYHRVVAARVGRHSVLERMAAALDRAGADVPVVNLLSDREHPTQALADILTLKEHFGTTEGRRVAYLGDANNVCRSLVGVAAFTGMQVAVASPPGYGLSEIDLAWARRLGASVEAHERPEAAVDGADALYTDVWVSMGQEEEAWARRRAFAGYTLDDRLLARAAPHAVVLHCLPAHRGEEITADVLEGPASLVFVQAANRMHALRGLLRYLLDDAAPGAGGGKA